MSVCVVGVGVVTGAAADVCGVSVIPDVVAVPVVIVVVGTAVGGVPVVTRVSVVTGVCVVTGISVVSGVWEGVPVASGNSVRITSMGEENEKVTKGKIDIHSNT